MTLDDRLPKAPAFAGARVFRGAACNGPITSNHGTGMVTGTGGNGGTSRQRRARRMSIPGKVTAPTTPFDAKTAFYATSKVKNLLIGMPSPTTTSRW